MIKRILEVTYTLWVYFIFGFFMMLLLPFMLIPAKVNPRWSWITMKVIKIWAFCFSKCAFVHYKIHNQTIPKRNQAYVYVSNHNSFLDSPALPLAIPGDFKALGKKELMEIPVFGWIIKTVAVMVDRSSAESRRASIERLHQVFRKGISVIIFPEGTINTTDKPLTPFYDGAFRLAIENQAPLLPLVILNSKKLMPRSGFRNKPGTIDVYFIDPIETQGMSMEDLPDLKKKIYHLMEDKILERSFLAEQVKS